MRKHLLLAAAAILPTAAMAELKVVASFSILGDLATHVGGGLITVETIVGAGQDAHVYSPSIADAQMVADADLIIFNGLGFESFTENLVSASGTQAHILVVGDDLAMDLHDEEHDHNATHEEHDPDHDDEHHNDHHEEHLDHEVHGEHGAESELTDHGHHAGEVDPHAWNAIANAISYVHAIEHGLAALDPANAEAYEANAQTYIATLGALKADYTARIEALPVDHRTVVTSHDAFGYLAAETGLTFLAPKGFSSISAVSAGQVFELIDQLNSLPHAAVFVQGVDNPAVVQQIAEETGYELGGSLYSDTLTPAGGPASTFVQMYTYNMDAILGALEAL